MLYLLIFVVLLMAELIYFRISGRYMGVELSLWFPVSVDVGSGDFSCWNIVCG